MLKNRLQIAYIKRMVTVLPFKSFTTAQQRSFLSSLNRLQEKIIAAIDVLPSSLQTTTFLLFLPEDEYHELGLLYVQFLLKSKGFSILYLGANVPVQDVEYINKAKQPHFFYLHLTSFPPQQSFQKYITNLSAKSGNATILISGSIASYYKKEVPQNVVLLKSFAAVNTYISSL